MTDRQHNTAAETKSSFSHSVQNGLEAMLACFGMFRFGPTWEEALRPCACLSKTVQKRCWHVLHVSGQVLFSSFVIIAPVTAGFAQCVCQDFTHCRFLMVFLCCQALAQDAGAHGQRASQALKFLIDHFLCCQTCSMFCRCFGRSLSLHIARIAARHLLDVTRNASDAVLMTFTEIP